LSTPPKINLCILTKHQTYSIIFFASKVFQVF